MSKENKLAFIYHRPTQAFVGILIAVALLLISIPKKDAVEPTQPTKITACCSDTTGEECCDEEKEKECCKENNE